jgi:hypothetical protein
VRECVYVSTHACDSDPNSRLLTILLYRQCMQAFFFFVFIGLSGRCKRNFLYVCKSPFYDCPHVEYALQLPCAHRLDAHVRPYDFLRRAQEKSLACCDSRGDQEI